MARVDRRAERIKRHLRVRKRVTGTTEQPRLAVFRSLHHIYAQIIDDTKGETLVAVGSVEPAVRAQLKSTKNIEAAKVIGKLIGERAREKGIKQVVFDRGGHLYHGRVAALADAAREAGLDF
ncbi:MAG TPA: 50S ribosomal protein L18 [Firmicutes bacterium]|nr:50S ribosomal protein L18 [Bacillota bacterium]